MRHLDRIYRKRTLEKQGEDLGTEYILDLLERFDFTIAQHRQIRDYCAEKQVMYFCTPWDVESVEVLDSLKSPYISWPRPI